MACSPWFRWRCGLIGAVRGALGDPDSCEHRQSSSAETFWSIAEKIGAVGDIEWARVEVLVGVPFRAVSSGGLRAPEIWITFTSILPMTYARERTTATLPRDGRVLLAGGREGIDWTASTELWDPSFRLFLPTNSMALWSRSELTASIRLPASRQSLAAEWRRACSPVGRAGPRRGFTDYRPSRLRDQE